MTTTTLGLLVGLALGFAYILGGFDDMVVVAFFGAVGWVIAKVLEVNDIDVGDYLGGGRRRVK